MDALCALGQQYVQEIEATTNTQQVVQFAAYKGHCIDHIYASTLLKMVRVTSVPGIEKHHDTLLHGCLSQRHDHM